MTPPTLSVAADAEATLPRRLFAPRLFAPGILCGALVLGAMLQVLLATRAGIGAGADSVLYVTAARNFAVGEGVSTFSRNGQLVPLTYFPPLLPVSLGLLGAIVGVDPLAAAGWFNAVLFGATALLAMLLTYRYSAGHSAYAAVLVGAVIVTSPHLLQRHATVMSEPLFLFLSLAGFLLLCRALDSGSSRLLLVAALVASLVPLTRFSGVAVGASGALLVLASSGSWSSRVGWSATFAFVSLAPLGTWLAAVDVWAGASSPRPFVLHAPQAEHLAAAIYTLRAWLVPEGWVRIAQQPAAALGLVAFCVLMAAHASWTIRRLRRRAGSEGPPDRDPLAYLLFTFVVAYLWVLAFSIAFFDVATEPNIRILVPVFVAVVILLGLAAARLMRAASKPAYARTAVGLLAACLSISYLMRGWGVLGDADTVDLGYMSQAWQQSETIALVRRMLPELKVYSNAADAIYILTGRLAVRLPAKTDPSSGLHRDSYPEELGQMERELDAGTAAVVYLRRVNWRSYMPDEDELQRIGLSRLTVSEDGAVYSGEQS